MGGILVFAEQRDKKVKKVTFELLSKGKEISSKTGEEVSAVIIGSMVSDLADKLAQYGAKKVYIADDERLKDYITEAYTKILTDLIKEINPSIFLCGATIQGKDLSPRVAARLGVGLATDCTEIELTDEGKILVTRPIFAGKVFVKLELKDFPQIVQMRPNALSISTPDETNKPDLVNVKISLTSDDLRSKVVETIITTTGRPELTEADIIVSGGRGMKGPENYKIIEELADLLGAAVGASRAAVDAGWIDHMFQVGQTGKTVSPNMYVACGISGAIQHLAGMSSSKIIVAINKDSDAPIFKACDYGVVGDLFQIVPLLTQEIKKIKETG